MIHSVHAVNKKDLNYKNDDVDINKYNNENVNFAESTNIGKYLIIKVDKNEM